VTKFDTLQRSLTDDLDAIEMRTRPARVLFHEAELRFQTALERFEHAIQEWRLAQGTYDAAMQADSEARARVVDELRKAKEAEKR
jgi:hypothetical protein